MDALPSEIIWHVASYLEPRDIVRLQHVCKRLLSIARDNSLWRNECFKASSFLEELRRRRELAHDTSADPQLQSFRRLLYSKTQPDQQQAEFRDLQARSNERIRLQANWDPSYPSEKIDWYSEFIHRCAPIAVSWLQQPRRQNDVTREPLEVRGVGTYYPPGDSKAALAVAPLDDGSVCLWDLTGSSGKKGGIVARSKAGILFSPGHFDDGQKRSKMIHTGVTECVSVNSETHKAYIAIQGALVEVDLQTLQSISQERYPFSVSALSESTTSAPITVGTNLSLHLYDPRSIQVHGVLDHSSHTEYLPAPRRQPSLFSAFTRPDVPNYAPLFHPGPLSILHLPSAGDSWNGNGDIYVAGRFPSILNYDRRSFPKLRGSIHSGARLCSLTSLPYPLLASARTAMRAGALPLADVQAAKSLPGATLVACGEYNSKGSLELYGLSPLPQHSTISTAAAAGTASSDAVLKNRQTCAASKLLAVAAHGPRLVFADGGGNLKWVERDGFTEVRSWSLAHAGGSRAPLPPAAATRGIFGTLGDAYLESSAGDIARKILHTSHHPTTSPQHPPPPNTNDLLLWTGEKLGLLAFSRAPAFAAADFEEVARGREAQLREREERVYAQTMRRALERQADEVRFVRGLGMGMGIGEM